VRAALAAAPAPHREPASQRRIEGQQSPEATRADAYFALFELHRRSGRFVQAQAVLARLDRALAPADAARIDLAGAYERLDQREAALSVWERFAASGARLGYDDLVKMASLYESSGRLDQALATWQAVWKQPLPVAQRSIVEDRIVTLAASLGRLGDLAAELEARHAAGRADVRDTGLLIHLYVSGRQKLSAEEAIEEYFGRGGADQLQVLREQASVYRLLQDSAAYERTLEKLIARDRPHRAEYLRALILHDVSPSASGGTRIEDLRRLLAQLRTSGGAGADDEFAAGVLALAGFLDEAIDTYRRGTVLAPELGDNYLLLGDALKRRERAGEAAFLFQHLAEEASTESMFVVAIDGLLNASSPGEGDLPSRPAVGYFKWAQRLILERITSRAETLLLHSILADVAETGEDDLRGFAALESSLPLAGNLRSALLRELITLATPNTDLDAGHLRIAVKDGAQRRIAYGRRLLALGDALPPYVYTSIGKDLLELRDMTGAALAFDQAHAESGEPRTLVESASLYDSAGFDDLALQRYRLAFISDGTDVDLMLRFARPADLAVAPAGMGAGRRQRAGACRNGVPSCERHQQHGRRQRGHHS
jgi:tetratricopeptide (TPR) repeat protein